MMTLAFKVSRDRTSTEVDVPVTTGTWKTISGNHPVSDSPVQKR